MKCVRTKQASDGFDDGWPKVLRLGLSERGLQQRLNRQMEQ